MDWLLPSSLSFLPTDLLSDLPLSFYSIWVNWVIRATFRISPPKDDRTSSEACMATSPDPSRISPQSSQRLSYLGISWTNRNSEVSLPLYSERICKVDAELYPGLPFFLTLSGILDHPTPPFSLSTCLYFEARPSNQPYTSTITKKRVKGKDSANELLFEWTKIRIQHWRMINPSQSSYSALSRGSKPFLT